MLNTVLKKFEFITSTLYSTLDLRVNKFRCNTCIAVVVSKMHFEQWHHVASEAGIF